MGNRNSYLSEKALDDYEALTFLTRQEILRVFQRYYQLIRNTGNQEKVVSKWRLQKNEAIHITELNENPFRRRIVEVFSSKGDGSLTFEDFLDMMSVFSENAPKSVKVSYAFKIYEGIGDRRRPENVPKTPNTIDEYDLEEIISRLSGKAFSTDELTKMAEAVIHEVDLHGNRKITSEIFEYFLCNAPDFPSTFVIRLSKGESDVHQNWHDSIDSRRPRPKPRRPKERQDIDSIGRVAV